MSLTSKIHPVNSWKLWFRDHPYWHKVLFTFTILTCMVFPTANRVDASTQTDQAGINNFTWAPLSADAPMLFNYMGDRSLRLDSNNFPHIAFGGDQLYYAYFDGSNWNFETVDPSDGVGLFASLALDSLNQPHISYYDSIHGALKYAYYDGANWIISTLDQYALTAEGNTTNSDMTPGITDRYVGEREWRSFPSGLPGDVNDPADILPISDLIGYGLYNSIAVDKSGNIHISYYDSANGNLKYAHTLLGSWISQTVDFTGDVGSYSSLAVNTAGYPQISYYDKTNGNLKFASFNGSNWVIQSLDITGDTGQYTSIALGQNQRPAISYYDQTNEHLRYTYFNGTSWVTPQTVDADAHVGQYTSLAMTSDFQPRISYFDADEANLRVCHLDGYLLAAPGCRQYRLPRIEHFACPGYIQQTPHIFL